MSEIQVCQHCLIMIEVWTYKMVPVLEQASSKRLNLLLCVKAILTPYLEEQIKTFVENSEETLPCSIGGDGDRRARIAISLGYHVHAWRQRRKRHGTTSNADWYNAKHLSVQSA